MQELTNRESNREIDSRVEIKNHIMEALRNPRFNMIGLCGLGGVGKTTIAKDIEKEEENHKVVFKKVIMATVSQEMNIGQIQDQIIEKLGMQLNERIEDVLLPKLEILNLSNLNSLISLIWDDQLLHNSLNNLKTLTVRSCGFVRLVPLHVLKSLNNLEELDVEDCDMLEIVFDLEDLNDYYIGMESSSVVVPLKKLKLSNLPKLKDVWCNNYQGNVSFPSLRSVYVDDCVSLRSIFPASAAQVLLPKLEMLQLFNLNSLISLIWDDQLLHKSFNNLKTLTVRSCGFVRLVTLHVLKSLKNLEELDMRDCDMLEIVFDFEDLNDYYKEMESSSVVVPLKELKLSNLPKLKNVWSNICQGNVSFPSLKSMNVYNCESLTSIFPVSTAKVSLPKLEILNLSKLNSLIHLIWDDQLLHNFLNNLKTLMVRSCGFVRLVPLHVLKSLKNLEELGVEDCDMLEIVFDFEDLNDYYKEMESSSMVVPLKELTLNNLPKLKSVWSNNCQGNVSFLSLKSIDVYECESLTSIFPASIAKGMLCDLEELQIRQCGVDVIVAKDQVLESVAVTFWFPRLTSLVLSDLPNLRNFYPQKHTLEWRHLNQLSIQCCDELDIFEKEVSENLERLTLQGKQVEKIGSEVSKFRELKLSGDFEKALGSDNVTALAGDWGDGREIWDTNLNKTFYHQRFMGSREVVLDEDDVIMIRNDQFQWIVAVKRKFFEEWATFPYTLLEIFLKLNELHVKNSSFREIFRHMHHPPLHFLI
ncbi:hypothetical protein K1719_041587 [Acacia pycnantha]|nr:hypothetical protein K1719_041587 [Acacia pycnantha]